MIWMCWNLKYPTWHVTKQDSIYLNDLTRAGMSPLAACLLVSRGYRTVDAVRALMNQSHGALLDPMLLPDMDRGAARVRQALERREKIAVYGDYDVDGITATCLLTDFLRRQGADCTWYSPARLEEGYGLNEGAIRQLHSQGVTLIVTVDCGITALEEADLCRSLSIDLVITDHHECKPELPQAVAVVDPHRRDAQYPFPQLAGVGVAFKLAAAVCGDQDAMFREYCDLVALGTIADVMPLLEENRVLVTGGIESMRRCRRVGLLALMGACQLTPGAIHSSAIGYTLAPRINAAGRMGQVDLAARLFLTQDPEEAHRLAEELCRLNRQRQTIEAEIFDDAVSMLDGAEHPAAIVLAGETWHQGVVGIVASRLAEEYGCPVFLICLSGDMGKASSRSCGGFPLFSTLEQLAPLLENYGGHELAAGFTIRRENIAPFREAVTALAEKYRNRHPEGKALELDCRVLPEMLTVPNVTALDRLEPFGAGFPRPQLYIGTLMVEQLTEVGGGKHLKLRFRSPTGVCLSGIFFSTNAQRAELCVGDAVEVAFTPQINDFRGVRSVQLNIIDIRPTYPWRKAMEDQQDVYHRFLKGRLSKIEALDLIPPRKESAALWRYLAANAQDGVLTEDFAMMVRKIARDAAVPCSFARFRVCLDIFQERGLIELHGAPQQMTIRLTNGPGKVDLRQSAVILRLKTNKREGDV